MASHIIILNGILLESPLVAIRVPPTNKEPKSNAPKPTEEKAK